MPINSVYWLLRMSCGRNRNLHGEGRRDRQKYHRRCAEIQRGSNRGLSDRLSRCHLYFDEKGIFRHKIGRKERNLGRFGCHQKWTQKGPRVPIRGDGMPGQMEETAAFPEGKGAEETGTLRHRRTQRDARCNPRALPVRKASEMHRTLQAQPDSNVNQSDMAQNFNEVMNKPSRKEALRAFEAFKKLWSSRYRGMTRMLNSTDDNIFTYYDFPKEIHKSVNTSNAIKSFNSKLKRETRNKSLRTPRTMRPS